MLLGLPDDPSSLARAVHDASLAQDIQTLEAGLETSVGTRGVKHSAGQVQRTATAHMLVHHAELLVIDDLTSALDVETERALWEHIFCSEDITCLAVTHCRAAMQRANHIILLQEGRIEAEGTQDELLTASEAMRKLWWGHWTTHRHKARTQRPL